MTTFVCIGDPHIQPDNIVEIDLFIERLIILCNEVNPDFICVLGDVLHTHEKVHVLALNKAYEFINRLRKICDTYVLVGNHDMCHNALFLTESHWMNGMKEWDGITIVDKVIQATYNDELYTFAPYVAPSRFEEALNTVEGWKKSRFIFAHQEFYGCKMGAVVSDIGDKWSADLPPVISGHIHSHQVIGNVYYTGSALQHAFGESEKNMILVSRDGVFDEVDLKLPRKKTVYKDIEDINDYKPPENTEDKIRVSISGNFEEIKAFKKTKKYKELLEKNIKVAFKHRVDTSVDVKTSNETQVKSFGEILHELVLNKNDDTLYKLYTECVFGK